MATMNINHVINRISQYDDLSVTWLKNKPNELLLIDLFIIGGLNLNAELTGICFYVDDDKLLDLYWNNLNL